MNSRPDRPTPSVDIASLVAVEARRPRRLIVIGGVILLVLVVAVV